MQAYTGVIDEPKHTIVMATSCILAENKLCQDELKHLMRLNDANNHRQVLSIEVVLPNTRCIALE